MFIILWILWKHIPQILPRKSAGNKGRDELAAKGPRKQATVSPVAGEFFPWKKLGGKEDEPFFIGIW